MTLFRHETPLTKQNMTPEKPSQTACTVLTICQKYLEITIYSSGVVTPWTATKGIAYATYRAPAFGSESGIERLSSSQKAELMWAPCPFIRVPVSESAKRCVAKRNPSPAGDAWHPMAMADKQERWRDSRRTGERTTNAPIDKNTHKHAHTHTHTPHTHIYTHTHRIHTQWHAVWTTGHWPGARSARGPLARIWSLLYFSLNLYFYLSFSAVST